MDYVDDAAAREAGSVYGPLIAELLADEDVRKTSVEQRALGVVGAAGGLVTLTLALATLALGKDAASQVPVPARILVALAITCFVIASVLALLANRPRDYLSFSAEDLDRMLATWEFDESEANLVVAQFRAEALKVALRLNHQKARTVHRATMVAVLGIGTVGAAVMVMVLGP